MLLADGGSLLVSVEYRPLTSHGACAVIIFSTDHSGYFTTLIPGLTDLERAAVAMGDRYYSLNLRCTRSMQIRKYFVFIEEF